MPDTLDTPDLDLSAAATAAADPNPAPAPTPAPSPEPMGTPGAAGTDPPAPAPAPSPAGVRGFLERQGIDVSAFPDEDAAARALEQHFRQTQQLQRYAPYVEQLQQHWSGYQEYLRQQQQQQQPPAPAAAPEKPWWSEYHNPPEYDPGWEKLVVKDEQGNLMPAQGAPPDIVNRYLNYHQYRQQTADKLLSNPYQFFEPAIKRLAREEAQSLIRENLGQYQDTAFAREFTAQNAQWLYDRDAQGQVLTQPAVDPASGQLVHRPSLSPTGRLFAHYVQDAERRGVRGVQDQRDYALGLVQRDLALAQLQQAGATQQGAAAKQQFTQGGHTPQHGAALPPTTPPVPGTSPPGQDRLSLGDRLRQNFRAHGVTDQTIQQER